MFVTALALPALAQEAPVSPAAVIQTFLGGAVTAIGPETVKLAPLKSLYGPRQNASLWLDPQGQPTPVAKEAVVLLGQADAEGLHSMAYHLASLEATAAPRTPQESAGFELLLSEGLGLYLHDLRVGRTPVGPLRDASYNETFDPNPSLLAASTGTPAALDAMVAGLSPTLPDYAALKKALAGLRAQAEQGGWPVLPPGGSLKPGMTDPGVAALRTRLGVEPGKKPQFYDDQLAGAVKAFQEGHAVKDDGAMGKDTRQALDLPVQARIDEVVAAMERLRWLPRDLGPRHVLVDVGGFWVRLVDNDQTTLQLGVIVGTTKRETPQLMSAINTVVVNPTWTVPPTIIKEDLLPKLSANSGYLAGRHIDLYRKTDDGLEPASADEVSRGNFNDFVFRQPAGEKNPAGPLQAAVPQRLFDLSARHAGEGKVQRGAADLQFRLYPGAGCAPTGRGPAGRRTDARTDRCRPGNDPDQILQAAGDCADLHLLCQCLAGAAGPADLRTGPV